MINLVSKYLLLIYSLLLYRARHTDTLYMLLQRLFYGQGGTIHFISAGVL